MASKKSFSISIDEQLWEEWQLFVFKKRRKNHKASEELEKALKEYMEKYSEDE